MVEREEERRFLEPSRSRGRRRGLASDWRRLSILYSFHGYDPSTAISVSVCESVDRITRCVFAP